LGAGPGMPLFTVMTQSPHAEADPVAAIVDQLLADHPDAAVAVMSSFSALYCDPPSSLPLGGHEIVRTGRLWDRVAPDQQPLVFEAWRRVRQNGVASASLKLPDGDPAALYFLDARATYGVVLALLVDGEPRDMGLGELGSDAPARSRFGRMRRDEFGRVLAMDAAAEQLLDLPLDTLYKQDPMPWIHPDHVELAYENYIETLSSPGVARRWRCRHRRGDGSYLWVEITNTNLTDDPEHGYVLSEIMDISDEMAANERAREREELLQRLAESLPSGIAQIEADGGVVYTNRRLHEILGVNRAATLRDLFASAVIDDRPRLASAVDRVIGSGVDVDLDLRVQRHDQGHTRTCQLTIRALRDGDGRVSGAVITVDDVTESTELRRELERRANIDALTACHNRGATMAALGRMLDHGGQPDMGTGVVFIDLDHFKPINDRLGHAAGDEVLAAAAERLRLGVRAQDLVGRLGGDEFLVVCPGIAHPEVVSTVAERIVESLAEALLLSCGEVVELKASIGIAWSVNDETTADRLVARADDAMYEAKSRRDGRPVMAPVPG
jgi:diguanylate cyclase (GGDEF)-like protein/PAS domain S-box-containing protein